MMRRAMIVVTVVALAGVSAAPMVAAHSDADRTVKVRDDEFDPAVLTIEAGTTVEWVNEGPSAHTIASHYHGMAPAEADTGVRTDDPTADAASFHAMLMPTDDPATHHDERTFTYTFENPGLYVIHCNLGDTHETMKQVIWVQEGH